MRSASTITLSVEDIISLPDGRLLYLIPGPRGYPGLDGIEGKRGKSSPILIQYLVVFTHIEGKIVYTLGQILTTVDIPHRVCIDQDASNLRVTLESDMSVKRTQVLAETENEMISLVSHAQPYVNLQSLKKHIIDSKRLRCYITFVI